MKKDFKNVIITFALIALVFTQASSAYQKKVKSDQVITTRRNELLSKTEQDKLITQMKKDEELQKQKIATEQLAIQNAKNNQDDLSKALAAQAEAELARQQAILLAQQQARAVAQAKAQAVADAQANALALASAKAKAMTMAKATVTSSRQSRTS